MKPKSKVSTRAKVQRRSGPRASKSAAKDGATRKTAPPAPSDWRDATLDRMRALILRTDPRIIEERKWRKASNPAGVPVWSCKGIVCTGERYRQVVKLTFAQGARLPDPTGLFNAGLEGNLRRAIDLRQGDDIDPAAFQALVKAAVSHNLADDESV
jgi:hypothetical protein